MEKRHFRSVTDGERFALEGAKIGTKNITGERMNADFRYSKLRLIQWVPQMTM